MAPRLLLIPERLRGLDDLLRGAAGSRSWRPIVAGGVAYGAVMGTYGGLSGDRPLQVAFSAAKVPMLLALTPALGLPSFFVLNTLAGLRRDWDEALDAVVGSQSVVALALVSLAPLVPLWHASTGDYSATILFHALLFGLAGLGGQVALRRSYRRLIARSRRHLWTLRSWLAIYGFVGIALAWTLRPFIGSPDEPPAFFRRGADWENPYVVLARLILRAIAG